jgi:hypothetical protein
MYNDEYLSDYERINEFNGEITEDHKKTYNIEKIEKIQLNNNIDPKFYIGLWDKSFVSKEGFPNYGMGFYGQWMRKKIAPLAKHLSGINLNEKVHICYRLIEETDENTLDYLCNNIIYRKNGGFEYSGRKSSGCSEDNIITYNRYIQNGIEESNRSFVSFNRNYEYMEENPIDVICPSYNKFYLNTKDARNKKDAYIKISEYKDIDEILEYINDCSSGFYIGREDKFDTIQEQWLLLIDKIKHFFDIVGHDKPFWTAYLPENIKKFEEVRVLTNCGNFINIIMRSKKYFYFTEYVR